MRTRSMVLLAASLLAAPLVAQDARARLESRGLPADLVTQVVQIAADATAQGLPTDPIVDKAIEGFAKHIPAPRIATALQQFMTRMADGRTAVRQAGIGTPGGELVAAAAEALGRGIGPAQVGTVVHAAREVSMAAPGLTVAAALAAQGMAAEQAVAVVTAAMRNGQNAAQILDLPSLARAMQGRGMSPDEAGRRMARGGGEGGPPDGGDGPRGPGGPGGGRGPGGPDGRPSGPPPPRPPGHGGPGSGEGGSGRPPRP